MSIQSTSYSNHQDNLECSMTDCELQSHWMVPHTPHICKHNKIRVSYIQGNLQCFFTSQMQPQGASFNTNIFLIVVVTVPLITLSTPLSHSFPPYLPHLLSLLPFFITLVQRRVSNHHHNTGHFSCY